MTKFLATIILLFSSISYAKTIKPKSIKDFYNTSVRIYGERSGGSGSIFKSYTNATHILTNKHICRIIEQGGTVKYYDKDYIITHYKKFPNHDLCLVRIGKSLGLSTVVGDTLAKTSSVTYASGHPSLLPHILTKGHLSDRMDIELVVGVKACEEGDTSFECMWFGGSPVVQSFESRVISNLIKPGSSGSGVFNDKGEIVGVVFAGDGRDFSHGYIVPHIQVLFFLQNAHRYDWVEVGTPVDDEGLSGRVFDYGACKQILIKDDSKYNSLKRFCTSIRDNMIMRFK